MDDYDGDLDDEDVVANFSDLGTTSSTLVDMVSFRRT